MKNALPDWERVIKRSLIKDAWNLSGGSAGARTLATIVTTQYGVKMSRYLAGKLMKELGLTSCQQVKHRYKRGSKEYVDIPNLHDHEFAVTAPNQVWCGDVTYILTGKRRAYLAVVLDLFARKPVGWALSTSPRHRIDIKSPANGLGNAGQPKGLMFHRDQVSHYTCLAYRQRLWRYQIAQSLNRRGNCWDNSQ